MAHPLLGHDESLVEDAKNCDLYLIFSGSLDIIIEGREVARRTKGETVGELELVSPRVKRMATVIACDKTMVGGEDSIWLSSRATGCWDTVWIGRIGIRWPLLMSETC